MWVHLFYIGWLIVMTSIMRKQSYNISLKKNLAAYFVRHQNFILWFMALVYNTRGGMPRLNIAENLTISFPNTLAIMQSNFYDKWKLQISE